MAKRKASDADAEYFPTVAERRKTKRIRSAAAPAAAAGQTTTKKQGPTTGPSKKRARDDDDQDESLRRSKRIRGLAPSPAPSSPPPRPQRLRLRGPALPVRPVLRIDTGVAERHRSGIPIIPPAQTAKSQVSLLSEQMSISDGPSPRSAEHLPPQIKREESEERFPSASPAPGTLSPWIKREESVESRVESIESGEASPVNLPRLVAQQERIFQWSVDAGGSTHHRRLQMAYLPLSEERPEIRGRYHLFTQDEWNQVLENRHGRPEGAATDSWDSEPRSSREDTESRENREREEYTMGEIELEDDMYEEDQEYLRRRIADLDERELDLLPHGFYEEPVDSEADDRAHNTLANIEEREGQIVDYELLLDEDYLEIEHGYRPPPTSARREDRQALLAAFERSLDLQNRVAAGEQGTMQGNLRNMLDGGDDLQDRIPWQRRHDILYGIRPRDRITPAERRIIAENPLDFTLSEIDIAIESREQFLGQGGDENELTEAELELESWVYEEWDREDVGSIDWDALED
ncbi:MAG: hypothetical protein Q9191_004052 [Dirinaria sp. TL-2023a]